MTELRVATFNLENFDDTGPGVQPALDTRITLMRPQIQRLRADIVCFQEVHGQGDPGGAQELLALPRLLQDTNLAAAELVSSVGLLGGIDEERNLVVASTFPVLGHDQYYNELVAAPLYRRLTAVPADETAVRFGADRPILDVRIDVGGVPLHVINVHLKSKIPTDIPGQKIDPFTWRTASGWAEGFFVSSLKRMSQAVEVRRLVDQILDADPAARIVVAGDFNADPDDIPVLAIRGNVEDTGNPALASRVLVPIEHTIAEPSRYTLLHQGRGQMLDHLLITRNLLAFYRGSEIHNEVLHDESAAFADDKKYPESDHAPVVATFEL